MRRIPLLCLTALLGSCAMGPAQPVMRSASGQRELNMLLTGRVAGPAISCLPNYNASDMRVIDGRTVAFRNGGGTAYLMTLSEGCDLLGTGGFAMVTKQFGSSGLCGGDIVQVADLSSHQIAGSCTISAITPYTRPRS